MTEYALTGILLNGKSWLVDTSATVVQPSQLTISVLTAPAENTPFTLHGAYANFTMNGLQYSTDTTTGSNGNWTDASSVSVGSGLWAFTVPGLAAATYTIWVRRTDATGVFAQSNSFTIASSGTSGSITQTGTVIDTNRIFSRDVETGNPSPFTTTYNKGYAAVPFTLSSTTAGSLFIALYDANSSGATSTAGTGTQLQTPVAVASVGAGGQTAILNIPAGPKMYYADFALDVNMTSALRIPTPFGVGHVTYATGQSLAVGFFNTYAYYSATGLDALTTYLPENQVYAPVNQLYGQGGHQPLAVGSDTWNRANSTGDGNTIYLTTFAPEYLSRITAKLGIVAALIGNAFNGNPIQNWDPKGYSNNYTLMVTISGHVGYKIDTWIWCQGDSNALLPSGEYTGRLAEIIDQYSLLKQKPFNIIASMGMRQNYTSTFRQSVYTNQAIVNALSNYSNTRWFDQCENTLGYNGHPSWIGRMYAARAYYRLMLSQRGIGGLGPSLTGAATRASGSKLINLTVAHDTGTALVAHLLTDDGGTGMTENGTPSSIDLASMFYVFPPGVDDTFDNTGGNYPQEVALDSTSPLTIISPTQIQLKLATAPADTVAFDVWYGWNQKTTANHIGTIVDDTTDADGIPHGRMLRQTLQPIYVPPPTAVTRTLAITAVNGATSSFTAPNNAITWISGTFAGIPPTEMEFAINGGSYVTGHYTVINNGGTWASAITSPANGTYTLTARQVGTTVVATGVSWTVADSDFPISGVTLDLDTRRLGSLYGDVNRTQAAVNGTKIKGVTDVTGNSNHLKAFNDGARLAYNVTKGVPGLLFNDQFWDNRYNGPSTTAQGLNTPPGAPLPASLRNASYTILVVCRTDGGNRDLVVAEPFWGKNNTQTLSLAINDPTIVAERNTGGIVDEQAIYTTPGDNVNRIRKYLMRFNVSTGTLKLQPDGASEISVTRTGDYNTGVAWETFGIGQGQSNTSYGGCFAGAMFRTVVIPGYCATDSERDAIMAYADKVYGT